MSNKPARAQFNAIAWARDLPTMLHRNRVDRLGHHLLLILATYAKNDGTDIWVSVDTLVDKCHTAAKDVQEALDRLIALGFVQHATASNGAPGWALDLSVRPQKNVVRDSRQERRRAASRERVRRWRERHNTNSDNADNTSSGNAEVQRYVTQELGVTQTESNAEVRRYSNAEVERYKGNVTPKLALRNAQVSVTPAGQSSITPFELPKDKLPKDINISPATAGEDETFARFYAAYPRRIGKKAAHKAWVKALKDGNDPEILIRAAHNFALTRAGQDPKYTPHPATWLNAGRWDDETPAPVLRAVSGDYRPWTNPTDISVYYEDLL